MKTLRLFLLVMLALTLPFRGAVAQIACCGDLPANGQAGAAQLQAHDHGQAQHHGHEMHAQASTQAADGAEPAAGNTPDGCHHCAAFCSSPAFASTPLLMPLPVAVATAQFSALSAPPPSHPGEGQERPPRRI